MAASCRSRVKVAPWERRSRAVAIGAGYFSGFQYEAWNRIPEVQLGAIYNRTESKARGHMATYDIPRYLRWTGAR